MVYQGYATPFRNLCENGIIQEQVGSIQFGTNIRWSKN